MSYTLFFLSFSIIVFLVFSVSSLTNICQLYYNIMCLWSVLFMVISALLFHAYVTCGVPPGLWSRARIYNRATYIVGGVELNLFDIEHGILRQNKTPPNCMLPRFNDLGTDTHTLTYNTLCIRANTDTRHDRHDRQSQRHTDTDLHINTDTHTHKHRHRYLPKP